MTPEKPLYPPAPRSAVEGRNPGGGDPNVASPLNCGQWILTAQAYGQGMG